MRSRLHQTREIEAHSPLEIDEGLWYVLHEGRHELDVTKNIKHVHPLPATADLDKNQDDNDGNDTAHDDPKDWYTGSLEL